MYGRDLFGFYCATCHGRDGKGGGPAVPALKVPPPDLTTIARRNGGTFPKAHVESFVTGDQALRTPAHGPKDMPVWGPIFRGLDPSDTMNRVRIANIVGYVESIQQAKGWLAWASVALCVVAIPAVFVDVVDHTRFYNVAGWGPGAARILPPLVWFSVTSVSMIRKQNLAFLGH